MKKLTIVGVFLMSLLGLFVLYILAYDTSPIAEQKLKSLVIGTPQKDVERKFGKPDSVFTDNRQWVYGSWWRLQAAYIYFDKDFRFVGYKIDD